MIKMQYFVMWLILPIDSVATLTFGIPERAMSLTLWCCAPWMLATSTSHRPPWATWRRREDKLWWAQPIWCDVFRGTGPTSWWDYIDWDHSPLNPSGYRTGFGEKPTGQSMMCSNSVPCMVSPPWIGLAHPDNVVPYACFGEGSGELQ